MNSVIVAAVALSMGVCGPAFAKSEEIAPIELEKLVVTPKTGGTMISHVDTNDLEVGDSHQVVSHSGAVIRLLKTEYGVEIYVDGDLLGISEHLALP